MRRVNNIQDLPFIKYIFYNDSSRGPQIKGRGKYAFQEQELQKSSDLLQQSVFVRERTSNERQ